MALQWKRAAKAIGLLLISVSIAAVGSFGAPKKTAVAMAKKKTPAITDAILRDRVIREFLAVYQDPPGSKRVKVIHTGKIKKYTERRGAQEVPAQAHRVAVTVKLTDCGITMRDIWEVYFYRLETEWIFLDIMQVASTQLNQTRKKHPALDNAAAKKIIADALVNSYPGLQVREITILGKKAVWRLCTPEYRITSKISVALKNEIYNTVTDYECLITSTLAHQNGTWEQLKSSCMYRGKEIADCHIGTMCRDLGTASTIPALQDADAAVILRGALEREYGLKKNNVEVEKFEILKRHPMENFGKKAPFTMLAMFVIDENKKIPGTPPRSSRVRAVYECLVQGYCSYSLAGRKWEGIIETCCQTEKDQCGASCSTPDKGCRRLGEK